MGNYEKLSTHKYCANCGKTVGPVKSWVAYFDTKTGEPIYHRKYSCQNWRWYSRTHFRKTFEGEDMVCDYDRW